MGYLTTITIYNDGIDSLRENSKEIIEKIINASTRTLYEGSIELAHDCFANLIKVHESRHADDHTCYVHMGNTVIEMNPYSRETKRILEKSPEYFDRLLKHMDQTVKELKKMRKEVY